MNNYELKKYFKEVYFVRFIIILSALYIMFLCMLYPLKLVLDNYEPTENFKVYMKGVIQNPEALYISALNSYQNGRLDKAIIDINLAMGIIGYRCNNYNIKICNLADSLNKNDK